MDKIIQNLGPVISIEITWGSEDKMPMVEGVLIVKTETEVESGNGWATYRVTAPLVNLVHWVAEHYNMLDKTTAHNLADVFIDAEFAKVTTAFGG